MVKLIRIWGGGKGIGVVSFHGLPPKCGSRVLEPLSRPPPPLGSAQSSLIPVCK